MEYKQFSDIKGIFKNFFHKKEDFNNKEVISKKENFNINNPPGGGVLEHLRRFISVVGPLFIISLGLYIAAVLDINSVIRIFLAMIVVLLPQILYYNLGGFEEINNFIKENKVPWYGGGMLAISLVLAVIYRAAFGYRLYELVANMYIYIYIYIFLVFVACVILISVYSDAFREATAVGGDTVVGILVAFWIVVALIGVSLYLYLNLETLSIDNGQNPLTRLGNRLNVANIKEGFTKAGAKIKGGIDKAGAKIKGGIDKAGASLQKTAMQGFANVQNPLTGLRNLTGGGLTGISKKLDAGRAAIRRPRLGEKK